MEVTYFGVFDPDCRQKMEPIEPDSEWVDMLNIWTKRREQNRLPETLHNQR